LDRPDKPNGLGVGVVWWPPLDVLCREGEGLVEVIETEPETFWVPTADGHGFRSFVGEALRHLPQPKLLHSVGAPVGGTCLAPDGHAAALARDVAELRPEYVSEHLNLTRFRPDTKSASVSAGFMLPSVQSRAGVELAAANIRQHRAALGATPLAVETTVSYLPPAPGEWPDGDYVAAVVEAADCGILLDLHNVLCNERNGRQSVSEFCDSIPLERVWEIHLAGGESERGFYLDAHSGLVEPELMEIAAALLPRLPHLRAVTFEIMPERVAEVGLAAIARQLGRIKHLWNSRSSHSEQDVNATDIRLHTDPPLNDPEAWERLLGCAITGLPQPAIDDRTAEWWRSASPALDLYRELVGEARASAVASAASRTTRLLLKVFGGHGTRRILAEFWRQSPPQYTAVDEARAFFRFLSEAHTGQPGLMEAISLDAAELARVSS
jgi:uncharacterized protein (UPF0276 family)